MSEFLVGYGRVDITPREPLPLMGYGNTLRRISANVLDPLYATCVAVSDGEGGLVLVLGVDATVPNYRGYIRETAAKELGIPESCILVNCTHSHSAPDMDAKHPGVAPAAQILKDGCVAAVVAAYHDMKPAKAFYGSIEATGLSSVRHYLMDDGSYGGDNFGDWTNHKAVKAVWPVDPTMHLLRFVRPGSEDVLVMNWRAHASITGGSTKPDISADFVGSVRSFLEAQTGCRFAYWQGCAGNVNPRSRIPEEDCTRDNDEFGAQLGGYAMKCLETLQPLPWGSIRLQEKVLEAKANHTTDHLLEKAKEIRQYYSETNDWTGAKAMGAPFGIRTPFAAGGIIKRASQPETKNSNLVCFTLGDTLAVACASHEMFDVTGQFVEDHSPFDHTIVLGYTNGQMGYMPTLEAWRYTCYESDSTSYAPGTAEQIADTQLEMLKELKMR